MLRKSTFDAYEIRYDVTTEPAEDYDLWVRILEYGKLYNLQEALLLYRVHDNQVSNTKYEIQNINSVKVRFKILTFLDFAYSECEKNSYINLISSKNDFLFKDVLNYLYLKEKLIYSNSISCFFEEGGFKLYLNKVENKAIKDYFLYKKSYKPIHIVQYFKIHGRINYQLNLTSIIKLIVKSLLYYKKQVD
jgi:hypothetical protein